MITIKKDERKMIKLCPFQRNRFNGLARKLSLKLNTDAEVYSILEKNGLSGRGYVLLHIINNYERDFVENHYINEKGLSIKRQMEDYLYHIVGDKTKDRLLKWFKESVIKADEYEPLFMIVSVTPIHSYLQHEDGGNVYREVETLETKRNAREVLKALESVKTQDHKYQIVKRKDEEWYLCE